MKFISTADLKRDTNKLLRANEAGEILVITRHGKPCSLLLHVDEGNLEQTLFEHSPMVMEAVAEGLEDLEKGRRISLDKYLHERSQKRSRRSLSPRQKRS